jgi:hypothetical protein
MITTITTQQSPRAIWDSRNHNCDCNDQEAGSSAATDAGKCVPSDPQSLNG